MAWERLCSLILDSIQIVGIFIAIIIGIVITKVMELKKEKNEITETLEDVGGELNTLKEQFKKLKNDNYEFYKKDNIFNVIDSIFDGEDFIVTNANPYVTAKEEEKFYLYVKKYIKVVGEILKSNISMDNCKEQLKSKKDSIEEIIIEEIYERCGSR